MGSTSKPRKGFSGRRSREVGGSLIVMAVQETVPIRHHEVWTSFGIITDPKLSRSVAELKTTAISGFTRRLQAKFKVAKPAGVSDADRRRVADTALEARNLTITWAM